MTTEQERERDRDIENRLSTLETEMAQLKELMTAQSNRWLNFIQTTGGGVVVAIVTWWITKK